MNKEESKHSTNKLIEPYTELEKSQFMQLYTTTCWTMLDIINTYHATSESIEKTKIILFQASSLALHPSDLYQLLSKYPKATYHGKQD